MHNEKIKRLQEEKRRRRKPTSVYISFILISTRTEGEKNMKNKKEALLYPFCVASFSSSHTMGEAR